MASGTVSVVIVAICNVAGLVTLSIAKPDVITSRHAAIKGKDACAQTEHTKTPVRRQSGAS